MGGELKYRVATGMAWNITEKAGSMLLQMVVSIVVARLLMPEDFGVMALLTFFTSIATTLVDSGFSQTLIRKADPTEEDKSSVFAFNLAVSLALYTLFTALAPAVASFYGQPVIARVAPVLFLLLPVQALSVIQNTVLTREFRFGTLSKATFASSVAGGAAAIAMALAGCGVWSLVGQRLATTAAKSAILWMCSDWRPSRRFGTAPIREMSAFSFRLLGTDLVAAFYNNIAQMFIGKIYAADTLGFFNQAQKFKDLPVTSVMQSVQSVTYPALSKIGGDETKLAESYRQVLMSVAFLAFPMMAGIAAVADDLFLLLLGEKWMPTVPYLRILCITGLFSPLAAVALNILKVKSDGRIILRLEIVKKAIMTAILLVTVLHSVEAAAWGLAVVAFCDFAVNITASTRYTTLTLVRIVRTLLPPAAVTVAMYASVAVSGMAVGALPLVGRLGVKIAVGAAVYIVLSFACRLESAREIRTLADKLLGRESKE